MTLTSEVDKGSVACLRITLDFITRLDLSREQSKRRDSDHTIKQLAESKKRILIAEDNVINRQIAISALSKLGFKDVTIAQNGVEVCTIFANDTSFDLIFMDCQMPERDGYEATTIIRKTSDVPIIALTASAFQGDREACLAAGMSDYLSKPWTPKLLEGMLVKWLH